MKNFLLLNLLLIFFTISTNCKENSILNYTPRFIENNGQVTNQNFERIHDVLYIASNKDFKIILKKNSLSFELIRKIADTNSMAVLNGNSPARQKTAGRREQADTEDNFTPSNFIISRIDVEFVGANPEPDIIKSCKSQDYIYFYTSNNKNDVTLPCFLYDTIIYKNLYYNIDLIFYSASDIGLLASTPEKSEAKSFKYDFVVHPGGNIDDIKLKYTGANDLKIENEEFHIETPIGSISEQITSSYTSDNHKVNVKFNYKNNVLRFACEEYDRNKTLVIDPYLMFSTYYGDIYEEIGMGVCSDSNNNIMLTGFTSSLNNIATTGAHQTTMRGGHDAFIVKFDSSNNRQWATYFGYINFDTSHDIAIDRDGNIYIVGWTKSKTNMSTPGCYQYNFGGGEFDAYIAKFNTAGQLQWSTYFGGQYDDYINDIIIDGYSNLIFTGRTSSPSNIASIVSYQPTFGGNNDAFIAKFSSSGTKLWSTYYGGGGFDVGIEISTDIFNNIALTGYTQSGNGIASSNAHQDTLLGIWDTFITKFTSSGQRLWGTYMGGTDDDFAWGIDFDGNGNIFITGNTNSSDNIATSGTHQETISSTETDAFVVKFNSSGSRLWGSYFGGVDEELGNVGIVDPWNNFTFAGNTYSDSNITTADAIKSYRAGQQDAFISIFSPSGSQEWGTYFGGVDNDFAHGLIFDKKSRLILIGYTFSSSDIATTGAYQETIGGGADAFLTRIGDPLPTDSIFIGDISGPWCADDSITIPYTISGTFTAGNVFTAQLSNASGLFSQFYDIGSITSVASGNITAYLPKEIVSGNKYRIRIVSTNPKLVSHDNGLNLELNELPKPRINGNNIVCSEHYYSYSANKSTTLNYLWSVTGGTIQNGNNSDSIYVLWENAGSGLVKLIETNSITSCKDSIESDVMIYEKVTAGDIFGALNVCPNVAEIYYTNETTGVTNLWKAINGDIVSDSSSDSVIVKWNEETNGALMLFQVSDTSGCNDSNSFNVGIYPLPKPFIIGDTIVKAYSTVNYRTSAVSGYSLLWNVEGGEIKGSSTDNLVQVDWFGSGIASVCLHQINKNTLCEDSIKITVHVNLPADDVIQGKNPVCSGAIEQYIAADSLFSYHWKVERGIFEGDSSQNTVHVIWGTPGIGYLHLFRERKSDKFRDSVILNIEILELPKVDFDGNNEVCEGITELYFNNLRDNFRNKWTVVNGTIIGTDDKDSVLVKWGPVISKEDSVSSGTLFLRHTDTLTNCYNDKIIDIVIHKKPETILSGDTLVCTGNEVNYIVKPLPSSSYKWNISGGIITGNSGDTSITVQWKDEGKGAVTVEQKGVTGCLNIVTIEIIIKPSPEQPVISQSGKALISSAEEGNQWYLSGKIIINANSRLYSPPESGIYSVMVTAENGCESEMSAPYYFDINDVNDIFSTNLNIVVFPNPVNDFVNIAINSDINTYNFISLEIYNLLGQRIMFNGQLSMVNSQLHKGVRKSVESVDSITYELNISDLQSGIYLMIININENKKIYNKLIKY